MASTRSSAARLSSRSASPLKSPRRSPAVRWLAALSLVLALAACQTPGLAPAEKANVRQTINAYQRALNNKSYAQLEPLLAPDIHAGGAGPELSRGSLQAGSAWPPYFISDAQILSLRQTPAGPEARVAFYAGRYVMMQRLGFDSAARLRSIDVEPLWKTPEPTVPNVLTSPFVVSGGLLFVKARVNGKDGYMLLDTGSSNLLLNPKYFSSSTKAAGVTATVNGIRQSGAAAKVFSLEWQNLRASDLSGELHDFSFMEKPAITPLLGAISFAELKTSVLAVDWKHKTVQVFATRPDGRKKSSTPGQPAPTAVVPFTYYLHLPSFSARIADRDYSMLFDSGAQWNMLPSTEGLGGHFHPIGRLSGFSDGGQAVANSSSVGVIDSTTLGRATFRDMPYALYQIPYFPGRGFLGAPLFQLSRVEINFRAKEISFWQ